MYVCTGIPVGCVDDTGGNAHFIWDVSCDFQYKHPPLYRVGPVAWTKMTLLYTDTLKKKCNFYQEENAEM